MVCNYTYKTLEKKSECHLCKCLQTRYVFQLVLGSNLKIENLQNLDISILHTLKKQINVYCGMF